MSIQEAVAEIKRAFGAPGDYGYETPKGKALYALYREVVEYDGALREAIRETAATADELAFWRYQAIFGRAVMLDPGVLKHPIPDDSRIWKVAQKQLETARVEENRERYSHSRDIGS